MAASGVAEYHVFVDFPDLIKMPSVGTVTEQRGGIWYEGKLLEPPVLGASFGNGNGMQRAADFTLRIADGVGGNWRTAAQNGQMLGTRVLVTAVMRMRAPDGGATETLRMQECSVGGVTTNRTEVTLRCTDLEATKFDKLYPPRTWRASDFPQLLDADAGRPVAYPVGTALKIPCPQIVADSTRNEYFFGVCTGTPKYLPILAINTGTRRITISGNVTDLIDVGQAIYITGSTAADGRYTVSAVISLNVIDVAETIVASSGGTLRLMPHVRTLYRAGRVVDPSEYTIVHIAARGPLVNGDFATGDFTGWTVTTSGSGSASVVAENAVLTGSGIANSAAISQALPLTKDLWHAVSLDVSAASTIDVRVAGVGLDSARFLSPGGRRSALFRATASGISSVLANTGSANGSVTFDNVTLGDADLVVALFNRPQVDFQGNTYAMHADVRGVDSRNAATEVSRLLAELGLTVDSASISAAEAAASANRMSVDCDYGRGTQRTFRAIVEDHLFLLRGALTRNPVGQYGIRQDVSTATSATFDESLGDSIDVDSCSWDGRPTKVSLKYRPSSRDPGSLQETISRDVAGGTQGEESTRALPYVRDHETADRLLSYLAKRRAANGRCAATVYRWQFELCDVIQLTSPLNWGADGLGSMARTWMVRDVQRTPNANKLDLIEYSAAVYAYTASPTLPTDASALGYEPDYSQTPPAAPSALTITAAGVALAPDGTSDARVTARCTPPPANWSQIWFSAIHNVTGEVSLVQGTDIGGGQYGTTIGGLRAGNVYQLKAYAVNSFNLQGALQGTFNATAIGGGAAVTTFTAPGYATLPPNVASCTAAQGTGRIVQVNWPAVSLAADVLGDYRLERNLAGGGWSEVWRGRANGYTDRNFNQYGQSVQYRVRAADRWGNVSAAYATSSSFTMTSNIYGGNSLVSDIRNDTVDTVNRTGVSLMSVSIAGVGISGGFTFAHGMTKTPMASVVGISSPYAMVAIGQITGTDCTLNSVLIPSATQSASGTGAHTHNLANPLSGYTISATVAFW